MYQPGFPGFHLSSNMSHRAWSSKIAESAGLVGYVAKVPATRRRALAMLGQNEQID